MNGVITHLRRNLIAYLALFAALGAGTAYAATKITSKQVAKSAIKSKHVKDNTLSGADINEATLDLPSTAGAPGVEGPAGPQGPEGAVGPRGATGPQGPAGQDGEDGMPGAPGDDGVDGDDGARGATGPQGPQGEQGVPGSARAYTRVGVWPDGTIQLDQQRTLGFTGIRRATTGTYCLTVANGINQTNRPYAVSVDYQTTASPTSTAEAVYNISTSPCNSSEFMVLTYRTVINNGNLSTQAANDVGFAIVVP
jgi:hypothetical protein